MEEITVANDRDEVRVQVGLLKEVRTATMEAMPDTGAWTLIINEDVREQLGLAIVDMVDTTLADGSIDEYGLTETVKVRWKDRWANCNAVVIPGVTEILLGALPLEGMDLMVDPVNKRLAGVHGDRRLYLAKTMRSEECRCLTAFFHFSFLIPRRKGAPNGGVITLAAGTNADTLDLPAGEYLLFVSLTRADKQYPARQFGRL
jgi:clan AA aspartic protease